MLIWFSVNHFYFLIQKPENETIFQVIAITDTLLSVSVYASYQFQRQRETSNMKFYRYATKSKTFRIQIMLPDLWTDVLV